MSLSETAFVVEKLVNGVWTQVDQQDRLLSDLNTTGEVLSYTDLAFAAGDQYRVFAQNTVGDIASTGFQTVTTKSAYVTFADQSGVAAPSGLTATLDAGPQVSLAWQDNSNNETAFEIERATDGVTFTLLDTIGADVMSYVDTLGLVPGNTYTYQVRALNANATPAPAYSDYSNQASVSVPVIPIAPSDLSTANVTETSLTLNWVNNELVNPVDGFTVQMATDSGFSVGLQEFTVAGNVTSLDVTGLTPGTTYYFQVNAFNLGGASAWSVPWMETTLATPTTPPLAPSNLNMTNYTLSSLTLAWTDNSSTEDGFRIQIATDKNFSQSLQEFTVGPNVTEYMFYPLAPNTKYYMRVAAFNVAGSSAWSPTLADKTLR